MVRKAQHRSVREIILGEHTDILEVLESLDLGPIECDCQQCVEECGFKMCFGTPDDIIRLIQAGFKDLLVFVDLINIGVPIPPIQTVQLSMDKTGCVLLKDGKYLIHKTGLKPLEGRMFHHYQKSENGDLRKLVVACIGLEWEKAENRDKVKYCFQKVLG